MMERGLNRAGKPVLAYVYRPVMARACYAADANTDECTFLGTGDQLLVSRWLICS